MKNDDKEKEKALYFEGVSIGKGNNS